jgi:phosphoribosylformimino-5-aminoimidazole carboxamide ribotide isomerase
MTATFDLIPAIDLRSGRVVRLRQGDFARETTYGGDPVAVATAFVDGGARWLHVVDLDGARAGRPLQADVIGGIVAAVRDRASVEVAGGLRTVTDVAASLAAGASRVVVGTSALSESDFAGRLVGAHGPERVAVALDVRNGSAMGHAWARGAAGIPVADAIVRLAAEGVRWFEVTAIDRDGTLDGPDTDLLRLALGVAPIRVIASGGIATVADLAAVRALGCAGAIVGRAIYEGRFTVAEAMAVTDG